MSLQAEGPNKEMIEYWNETTGSTWVERADALDAMIGPLGLRALDRAALGAGDRVLDVGCGCGQSSVQIADRVGADGSVLGIDISSVMLARARERVAEAGLANVRFENADAQTHAFEPGSIDHLFSRFGVMFFADPPAAFANLRSVLAPGGRLTFVCWQGVDRNPWLLTPLAAVAKHAQLPPPPEPGAPGPFAFADENRVRGILENAGFRDVAFEDVELDLTLAAGLGLDGAVEFCVELGPTATVLREAKGAIDESAVRGAIRDALEPHLIDGGVRLGSAAWIATAGV